MGPIESELELYPLVVTYHTPFAKEMMGKKVGEHFMLDIGGKDTKFTINAIEKITSETPKCQKKSLF